MYKLELGTNLERADQELFMSSTHTNTHTNTVTTFIRKTHMTSGYKALYGMTALSMLPE